MSSKVAAVLAAGLLATSCHNTDRENLLDPTLTPGVALVVALNDTTGHARLSWSPYDGEAPFERYLVLRNEAESVRVDTLIIGTDVSLHAFTDTTLRPNRAYAYRISVVNSSGLEIASGERRTQGFNVEPIRLINLDPEHGPATMRMRWTRYRSPGFERYRILRRTLSNNLTVPLGEIVEATDTTFTDTTLLASVNYEWSVTVDTRFDNTEFASLQSDWLAQSVLLTSVRLSDPVFDASTATATLTWRTYEGPRFRSYRIVRSTPGLTPVSVATFDDLAIDTYVDGGLVGGTRYDYEVVVITERDEVVPGLVRGGQFFTMVDEFPLDMQDDEFVRLFRREQPGMSVIVAGPRQITLMHLTTEGVETRRDTLVRLHKNSWVTILPQSVSAAPRAGGGHAVSLSIGGHSGLLFFDAVGTVLRSAHAPFADILAALTTEEREIAGEISLIGEVTAVRRHLGFDSVRLTTPSTIFVDPFDERDLSIWPFMASFLNVADGWGYFGASSGAPLPLGSTATLARSGGAWEEFSVVAEMAVSAGSGGLRIGTNAPFAGSFLALVLNYTTQQLELAFGFRPARLSELDVRSEEWAEALHVFPGLPYRMELGLVNGNVRANVEAPIIAAPRQQENDKWAVVTRVSEISAEMFAYIAGDIPATITDGEQSDALPLGSAGPAEVRMWRTERPGVIRVGLVAPDRNLALIGLGAVRQEFFPWPRETSFGHLILGTGVGQQPAEFVFPLSIDADSQGNAYVLDAGNARIQVFDTEGDYVTQWGTKGSAPGEFDFGSGRVPEDFAGSIIVDEDDFVYVADPGNRRIQKFAP